MKIKRHEFSTIVPAPHRAYLKTDKDYGQVLHRVHRYYCTPLTRKGKCPEKCGSCKPLPLIFKEIYNSTDVKDRQALLVWYLRSSVATISELSEVPRVQTEKDWLGMDVQSTAASFRKTLSLIGDTV